MTARIITLWRVHVTSLTTSISAMRFLIEIIFILKAIKSHFKGANFFYMNKVLFYYDKRNLTIVVILYEIYETHRRLII